MYTRPASIRRARAQLKRIAPYRAWVRQRPRSPEAIEARKLILRELGAIIAGQRPDVITGGGGLMARCEDVSDL
jgi:hypothetical protein